LLGLWGPSLPIRILLLPRFVCRRRTASIAREARSTNDHCRRRTADSAGRKRLCVKSV